MSHGCRWICIAWPSIGLDARDADGGQQYRQPVNHRFSPRIEVGLTGLTRRVLLPNGQVAYSFGATYPLTLAHIVEQLTKELDACYAAFDQFKALVGEHEEAIISFEKALSSDLLSAP